MAAHRTARIPLLLMAIVGTLAFNYPVSIPLITTDVFGTGPATFGLALSLLALGAFLGALYIAGRRTLSIRYLGGVAVVFGGIDPGRGARTNSQTFHRAAGPDWVRRHRVHRCVQWAAPAQRGLPAWPDECSHCSVSPSSEARPSARRRSDRSQSFCTRVPGSESAEWSGSSPA